MQCQRTNSCAGHVLNKRFAAIPARMSDFSHTSAAADLLAWYEHSMLSTVTDRVAWGQVAYPLAIARSRYHSSQYRYIDLEPLPSHHKVPLLCSLTVRHICYLSTGTLYMFCFVLCFFGSAQFLSGNCAVLPLCVISRYNRQGRG
jgi:hypothetical protein